ncbi:MAG: nucleotidyltransferase family protein [Acidobacteria bacterium]|nr:nucleotidyltransferase family protein [Acidobacteriota bacterium]
MSLTGVVLAAGASRRMGFPKTQLLWHGETYLARLVRLFGECSEVVVVLREQVAVPGARVVVNPDPERGMLSSLQLGMAVAPGPVLFTPVDFGHVRAATIRGLVAAYHGQPVFNPRCDGRRGHPTLISQQTARALLAMAPTANPKDLLQTLPPAWFDCDDPGILRDVDDPEAYRRVVADL